MENSQMQVLTEAVLNEMKQSGFSANLMRKYRKNGFGEILQYFHSSGQSEYSDELVDDFVELTQSKYNHGDISRFRWNIIYSSAGQLKHFHRYGCLRREKQHRWNTRKLTEYFSRVVEQYFSDECKCGGINKSTARNTVYGARQILFELEDSGFVTFNGITPRIVSDCVTRIATRYKGGASGLLTCLRRFLRYLHSSGIITSDLSKALPELAASHRAIRPGFSDNDKNAILSVCAAKPNAHNKRDYAIMLLASQTGLRGCDIIALERTSINWRTNEIKVVQSKTGKAITLPLPVEAGNAVADYLLNYRPKSDAPHIFLRTLPPYHRLKVAGGIVQRYVDMVGISSRLPERSGFHSFRRAFGKSLLESETSLDMLQELLGQTDMDSAKPYLAIDEIGLKRCALGLVCGNGGEF